MRKFPNAMFRNFNRKKVFGPIQPKLATEVGVFLVGDYGGGERVKRQAGNMPVVEAATLLTLGRNSKFALANEKFKESEKENE